MNGQKAVSIAQVGQVHFDEWVSITSAATATRMAVEPRWNPATRRERALRL